MTKKLEELCCNDDLLERNEPFIVGLMELIKGNDITSANDSTVIAIDSGWGTGKTWLMHMLQNRLKETGEYETVFYNAWECDDWSNALIPFVARIKDKNSKIYQEEMSVIQEIGEKSTKVGVFLENNWKGLLFKVIAQVGKKITGVDADALKKEFDDIEKELNLTEEYDNFVSAKDDFKKELAKLGEKKKIVFLIDELDRCKPTFAIETLEVVKHFFNVKNFMFVFALDMIQLSHSIATVYGQGMDSVGYLRRFFDMQLRIPSPSLKGYLKSKIIEDIIPMDMQERYRTENIIGFISDIMERVYEKFNLSLRDIDIISNNFVIFLKYNRVFYKVNAREIIVVYLTLIILKYKEPIIFDKIMHSEFEENIVEYLDHTYWTELFVKGLSKRMKIEIIKLPDDSRKSALAFKGLKLNEIKENERVYQYFERQLEIISLPSRIVE